MPSAAAPPATCWAPALVPREWGDLTVPHIPKSPRRPGTTAGGMVQSCCSSQVITTGCPAGTPRMSCPRSPPTGPGVNLSHTLTFPAWLAGRCQPQESPPNLTQQGKNGRDFRKWEPVSASSIHSASTAGLWGQSREQGTPFLTETPPSGWWPWSRSQRTENTAGKDAGGTCGDSFPGSRGPRCASERHVIFHPQALTAERCGTLGQNSPQNETP